MKIERLKNRADFLKAAKNGRRWITPAFVVQVFDHDDITSDSPCRVGFTVTKKLDKRAVVRNRAKRRLKEMAQIVLQNYDLYGKDVVFIARNGALTQEFTELERNCRWALKRMEIKKHGEEQKTPHANAKSKNS